NFVTALGTEVSTADHYKPIVASGGQHTRRPRNWSSDVCAADLTTKALGLVGESATNDLAVTLDATTAAQDATITVTAVSDGGTRSEERRVGKGRGSRDNFVPDLGNEVSTADHYKPTEADTVKYL